MKCVPNPNPTLPPESFVTNVGIAPEKTLTVAPGAQASHQARTLLLPGTIPQLAPVRRLQRSRRKKKSLDGGELLIFEKLLEKLFQNLLEFFEELSPPEPPACSQNTHKKRIVPN